MDGHADVRIRPLVRRVRNPPIRNVHICPCDSAGYYNEFLCTNSQTDYVTGLDERVGQQQRRLLLLELKSVLFTIGHIWFSILFQCDFYNLLLFMCKLKLQYFVQNFEHNSKNVIILKLTNYLSNRSLRL